MGFDEANGKCKVCGDVLVKRKATNHLLHGILTVCTLGTWAIIWVLSSIKFGGWKCSKCGRSVSKI